jgi:hypothetical protein
MLRNNEKQGQKKGYLEKLFFKIPKNEKEDNNDHGTDELRRGKIADDAG